MPLLWSLGALAAARVDGYVPNVSALRGAPKSHGSLPGRDGPPEVAIPMASPPRTDDIIQAELRNRATAVEARMAANLVTYWGPIEDGVANILRAAIEEIEPRRRRLAVNLETDGGDIEAAERIAHILRHHYAEVDFLVTSYAMSAGVLVMSGDNIYMDYSATLGPIDPQLRRPGSDRYVPALGYLEQYQRLIERSAAGEMTPAELAYLIQNFDPAELYQYEQARDLSIALLEEWLVNYKFRNWKVTASSRKRVTSSMRRERAEEIARKLIDTSLWHSHSRGISLEVARRELNLIIEDLDDTPELRDELAAYNELLLD